MSLLLPRGGWGQIKPPPATPVDWGNPITADLTFVAPFNEDGGRPQEAVSSQVITSVNGYAWHPLGLKLASASSQYFTVSHNARWTRPYLTVAAWVNLAADGQYQLILDRDDGGSARAYQLRKTDAEKLELIIFNATPINASAISTTSIGGRRCFVAGTYDGVTIRTYVNGVPDGTTSHAGVLNPVTRQLNIGKYGGASLFYLNGTIEGASIWNRPLSAADVAALYADPYQMFTPPVWRRYFVDTAAPPPATRTSRLALLGVS